MSTVVFIHFDRLFNKGLKLNQQDQINALLIHLRNLKAIIVVITKNMAAAKKYFEENMHNAEFVGAANILTYKNDKERLNNIKDWLHIYNRRSKSLSEEDKILMLDTDKEMSASLKGQNYEIILISHDTAEYLQQLQKAISKIELTNKQVKIEEQERLIAKIIEEEAELADDDVLKAHTFQYNKLYCQALIVSAIIEFLREIKSKREVVGNGPKETILLFIDPSDQPTLAGKMQEAKEFFLEERKAKVGIYGGVRRVDDAFVWVNKKAPADINAYIKGLEVYVDEDIRNFQENVMKRAKDGDMQLLKVLKYYEARQDQINEELAQFEDLICQRHGEFNTSGDLSNKLKKVRAKILFQSGRIARGGSVEKSNHGIEELFEICRGNGSRIVPSAQLTEDYSKRDKLSSEAEVTQKISGRIPPNLTIGAALGKGDCFFDAIAQGLNQHSKREEYTVKSLRLHCDEYVKSGQHPWVKEELIKDEKGEAKYNDYLARIAFTAKEMEAHEYKRTLEGSAVWGRPNIEGRIFCETYGIKLHIIEVHEQLIEGVQVTEQFIDATGSHSIEPMPQVAYSELRVIHLVNYRNHFVPLVTAQVYQQLTQASVQSPVGSGSNAQSPEGSFIGSEIHDEIQQKIIENLKKAIARLPAININSLDSQLRGLVHLSCRKGNEHVVAFLIEQMKADFEYCEGVGLRPIYHAIHFVSLHPKKPKVIEKLLEYGAKVDNSVRDEEGLTPLSHAAIKGEVDNTDHIIEIFLKWAIERNAKNINILAVSTNNKRVFLEAALADRCNVIKMLFKYGILASKQEKEVLLENPLRNARVLKEYKNYLEKCSDMLELGTLQNSSPKGFVTRGSFASFISPRRRATCGSVNDVRHPCVSQLPELLKKYEVSSSSPPGKMSDATMMNDAKKLAKSGSASNILTKLPFFRKETDAKEIPAAKNLSQTSLSLLLDDIDRLDGQGLADIHKVCIIGHMGLFDALVKKRAALTLLSAEGISPLEYAIYYNNFDIVQKIIQKSENPLIILKNKNTLLHIAVAQDDNAWLKQIIDSCIATSRVYYIFLHDAQGDTALMKAILAAKEDLIDTFISYGIWLHEIDMGNIKVEIESRENKKDIKKVLQSVLVKQLESISEKNLQKIAPMLN